MQRPSALSGLSPQKIFRKNFFYFFLKNPALKKFRESYIQNPGIFRTRSIYRTLVYSEPEAYSEHCQTSTMERFTKISYLVHFKKSSYIFLYFWKWNFLALVLRKFFLHFRERKPRKKISCISGK